MADTKISNMTPAAALTGTEIIPVVQSAANVRTTTQSIANLGGGAASHTYFAQACALLEPLAIEKNQLSTFSYVIGSSATKYLISAWNCRVGASGRIDMRDMRLDPLPLRNITVVGIDSGSTASFIDPALPTYADPWTTYYNRLETLTTLATKYLAIASLNGAANTQFNFLPGPYGNIITAITTFNYTWTAVMAAGTTSDLPLQDELGDAATDWVRFANTLRVPISKSNVRAVEAGFSGGVGTAAGSVLYVILPSTWGAVTDPNTYLFRDDFTGATLNTAATWTRTQSSAGNVEIDTNFAWCKIIGNGTWGANGAFSQFSTARAAGKIFQCDVAFGINDSYNPNYPNVVVGWHDGAGHSYTDFAHGLDFTGSGASATINVFENGNSRGAVGSGWTKGHIYRVRITLAASSATYEIQGGTEYAQIGGSTWTNITPGTTSSSTTPLSAGMTCESAVFNNWIGDVKLYT